MENTGIEKQKSSLFIIALAVFCQMLWGSVFPFIKVAYRIFEVSDIGSTLNFAGTRFSIAGLVLLIIASIKEKSLPKVDKKDILPLFLLGTIQTGMVYAFQFIAMLRIPSINCSIINGLQPALTLVVANFMFKDDKITARKMTGAMLGLSGVMFCFLYGYTASSISLGGEGLMFLSMLTFVFGTNYSRKVTGRVNPITAAGFNLFIGGLELLLISFVLGGRMGTGNLQGWMVMAFLVFASSVCLFLWTMLGHVAGVSRIAVFLSVNPISGAVAAALVAGEDILQLKYIVAIVLVVAGIIVINTKGKKGTQNLAK